MERLTIPGRHPSQAKGRRPRRGLIPEVRPLEGRRLLTGLSATAVMTQTATFPNLEADPTVSDQALLYFSASMGTLTEVDLVTSGSFQSQLSAEDQGATGGTVAGTTTGDLSIGVPTGALPVTIPAVNQTVEAPPFGDATAAAVTSNSTPATTVLTSPANLAAFTGFARMPVSVTGHATGSASTSLADVSTSFQTQTSATITVIYHYIPNLSSTPTDPVSSPSPSSGGGTVATPIASTGTTTNSTGSGTTLPAAPSTGTPSTGAPSTGAPSTGAPSTGAPSTGTGDTPAATTTTASHRRVHAHRSAMIAPSLARHPRRSLVRTSHERSHHSRP